MPARIVIWQCFLYSAIPVIIWFLAISSFTRSFYLSFEADLDFAFHLLPSVITFSRLHLYPAFAHGQTISTSSLWGILPRVYVCLSRYLHFWHGLVFPLAYRNMCNFLSSFFLTAQNSAPMMQSSKSILWQMPRRWVLYWEWVEWKFRTELKVNEREFKQNVTGMWTLWPTVKLVTDPILLSCRSGS